MIRASRPGDGGPLRVVGQLPESQPGRGPVTPGFQDLGQKKESKRERERDIYIRKHLLLGVLFRSPAQNPGGGESVIGKG